MSASTLEIPKNATANGKNGSPSSKSAKTQYVYFFGGGSAEGNGSMKETLGGKGAGLAEMTNVGLPVLRASPSRRKHAANI